MGTVLYKEFIGFGSPVNFTWGSVITSMLLKTVENFTSGIASWSDLGNSGNLPSSNGLVHNVLFFCPLPLSDKTIIDGPVFGNVGVKLWNSTGDNPVHLKSIYINVVTVASTGAETSLSGEQLIWSGTRTQSGGVYPNSPTESTVLYPFWTNIDWKSISRNSRIGLRVKIYGYATTYYVENQWNRIYISFDHSSNQTAMSLPIALSMD